MTRYLKSALLVVLGLGSIVMACACALFLYAYLVGGAGLQVFGFHLLVTATTVWMGLVHVTGSAVAAGLCFVIGLGLCVHGFVPPKQPGAEQNDW